MTSVKCYQRCTQRSDEGFCMRQSITLDTRGACLYLDPGPKTAASTLKTVEFTDEEPSR